MNDWEPSPVLVGESDEWDPDQTARRRRLSGVAQGQDDLRAMALHHGRDPDEAIAEWERYARDHDDDSIAAFNQFTREWQIGPMGRFLGANNPLMAMLNKRAFYNAASAQSAAQDVHRILSDPARAAPRPTAAQIHDRIDQFAAEHNLDPAALWQEFNTYYMTTTLDLDGAAAAFLAENRLAGLTITIEARIADSLVEGFQRMQEVLFGLQRVQAAADNGTLTLEKFRVVAAQIEPLIDQPEPAKTCYRCGTAHGSRACQRILRQRH